jgi:hypothetical protein
LEDFKVIKSSLLTEKLENVEDFKNKKKVTNLDIMHLYTFYECYSKKCEVFFANNEHIQKEIDQ